MCWFSVACKVAINFRAGNLLACVPTRTGVRSCELASMPSPAFFSLTPFQEHNDDDDDADEVLVESSGRLGVQLLDRQGFSGVWGGMF